MAYPYTPKLEFPFADYELNALGFGMDGEYGGSNWGKHLGEDCLRSAGTKIGSIGKGRVVYSALHAGTAEKGNWGNIVIIAHKQPQTQNVFFSFYGHLGRRFKEKGDNVEMGEEIGTVGKKNSPENGWWAEEHLHFSIYVGPWNGKVLPGYFKKGQKRTKLSDWKAPTAFIEKYQGNQI